MTYPHTIGLYDAHRESILPARHKSELDAPAYSAGPTQYPEVVPVEYSQEGKYLAPPSPPPSQEKRYCGLSRTVFFLILALLLVIIAGAIGGGVGGSLAEKNKNKQSTAAAGRECSIASSCSSSSPIATSVNVASSTSPAPSATATIGAVAAASYEHVQDSANYTFVFVFYQQGPKIMYALYPGSGEFEVPQEVSLTSAPKTHSPITATSYEDSMGSHVNLFYLDEANNIITIYLYCALNNTVLTPVSSGIAQSFFDVLPSSALAALYLGDSYGLRVYYQTTKGFIQELVGSGEVWTNGTSLSQAVASPSSPIAASMDTIPNINIFYVGAAVAGLYNINYSGDWNVPNLVTSASVQSWDGSFTSLAAAGQTLPNTLRTYFIGKDNLIWEFVSSTNSSWGGIQDVLPNQPPSLDPSDTTDQGSFAAIGWADQIRLYYVSGGQLVQAVLSGDSWAMGRMRS